MMMSPGQLIISPRQFFLAILMGLGIWWCMEVIKRFGEDRRQLVGDEPGTRKFAIVSIWLVTLAIAVWLAGIFRGIIVSCWHAWH